MFRRRKAAKERAGGPTMIINADIHEAFFAELMSSGKEIGKDRQQLDMDHVKEVVKAKPEAARQFIDVQCLRAESDPVQLQIAAAVGLAYAVELGDKGPAEQVWALATALGAEDQLARMNLG